MSAAAAQRWRSGPAWCPPGRVRPGSLAHQSCAPGCRKSWPCPVGVRRALAWGRAGPAPGRGLSGLAGVARTISVAGPLRGARPPRHRRAVRLRAAASLCFCPWLLWCGGLVVSLLASVPPLAIAAAPRPRAWLSRRPRLWCRWLGAPPLRLRPGLRGLVAAGGPVATVCAVLVALPRSSCARLGRSVAAPPPVWSGGWVWWWSVAGRRGAPPWGALLAPRGGGCRRGCCCSWWPLPSVAAHPARRVGQAPARVQALRARPTPGGGEAQPSRSVL